MRRRCGIAYEQVVPEVARDERQREQVEQPDGDECECAPYARRERRAAEEHSEGAREQQLGAVVEHDSGAEPAPDERELDREQCDELELQNGRRGEW